MGTITVTIPALSEAIEQLSQLSSDVTSARASINSATPSQVHLSSMSSTGATGQFSSWADENVASPLQIVLDTAKLLEQPGNTGPVTITYTGAWDIDKISDILAEELADKLQNTTDADELESYLEMLAQHADNIDIQEAVVEEMGPSGVTDLLTHAGAAGIPMATVTAAFSDESQETIAGWVADDITDPENIDLETVTLMAGFSHAPAFSESLYTDVTPDQMSVAIQHLNNASYPQGLPGDFDDDAMDLYSKFINSAGTTFATYTNVVDDPEALAETWFNAITDDENQGNAAALTFLIRKGGENAAFDPDFLYRLTEDVYQWELDQDGAVWGPRVQPGESGMALGGYIIDPDVAISGDPYTFDYARRVDGLANLLGSMEYTPEAAQRFFAHGYENGDPGGTNSRVEYLMLERTFSGSHNSDEGYGLGVALEAAAAGNTTSEYIPGIGRSDEWSAGFATDLFNFVAEHDQAGEGHIFDNVYHGYPGTSVALGNIGAAYASDIYDIVDNPDHFVPTGATSLRIDGETLATVIGQVGHHDDMSGLETLSAGLVAEGNERFRGHLEGLPGDGTLDSLNDHTSPLAGVLDSNGEVLGRVLDWGLESKYEDEQLDQARAEFAAKAFDIATDFIPGAGKMIPSIKDTLWAVAVDSAKSEGVSALKDAISNSPDATSGQYAEIQNASFENLIRFNTYDQLLATGYLDDSNIADVLIVGEGDERRFRDDIRFDGVDGMPDPDEEGISAAEAQARRDERLEVQEALNDLLSVQSSPNGPGAHLQGLMTDALNGYDRVKPEPEN